MKNLLHIFIGCIFFMAVGCSPVYYQPNLINAPNFRAKGDVHLSASFASNGGDVQAAYAFTDHFAAHANFTKCERKTSSNNAPTTTTKGQLGEVAAGYFRTYEKDITLSLVGGYGQGQVSNDWATQGASSADFRKLFIQPSLGARYKILEVIVSAKLANLSYFNRTHTFTNQDFIKNFQALNTAIPILETGIVIRLGGEHVKVQLQSNNLRFLKKSTPQFIFEKASAGVGLCIQLNGNKTRSKQQNYEK